MACAELTTRCLSTVVDPGPLWNGFLLDLLKAEQAERRVRSIRYRLGIARFPVSKDLDGFDFQDSHVGEARIRDLYQGGFMESWINVVFVGGTGTGKTHLSIAIGSNAVRNGARVRFFQSGGPRQPARAGKGGRQGRTAGRDFGALRLGHPGRTRLPAVFPGQEASCSFTCSQSSTRGPRC